MVRVKCTKLIYLRTILIFTFFLLNLSGVLAVAAQGNAVKKGSVEIEFRDAKNLEGASKPAASITYNGYVLSYVTRRKNSNF